MSSYEAWLQWITTSSPGCHFVTPSPTVQTMPEASEPPMWWSSFGCERNTLTGLPSAAQTLLKFTPAAITRTITSNAPGCGTSICSSWKASIGSPSRSCRITQAAIVSGRVPGSTPTSVTSVRSTCATDSSGVGRPGMVAVLGGTSPRYPPLRPRPPPPLLLRPPDSLPAFGPVLLVHRGPVLLPRAAVDGLLLAVLGADRVVARATAVAIRAGAAVQPVVAGSAEQLVV